MLICYPTKTNLMSKFQEICQAYQEAQNEFKRFQNASVVFAEELWKRMVEYFEVPINQTTLYKISEQGGFEIANPPFGDFITLRNDGFWEFGIGITVFQHEKSYPRDNVLLYLLIRKDLHEGYQVKLAGSQEFFTIHENNDTEYEAFFNSIYNTIIDSYHTGLERLLQEQTTNRIGFDIDEVAKNPRQRPA